MRQLNKVKVFGKVRTLIGATALFVLLLGMTAQAAEITPKWYADKSEWDSITGYHLGAIAQTMSCDHGADDNAVIGISISGSGLNPDKTYLKGYFKLRGATSKMSQKYKDQIKNSKIIWETLTPPGLNSNQVSSQVAKIKINGKEYVIAAPYLCPDGYAGYAYFRHYFSYCENTGEFYYVSSEHEWLACARGDLGVNEYHPGAYEHNIYRYYIEPNKYTIAYDGNGETSGSTASQKATYDETLKLRNNGFKKTGHVFTEWNTKEDGSGKTYSQEKSVTNLTSKDGGKVTLYARWEKASYTLTVKPNGGSWGGKTTDQNFTLASGATKTIANPTRTGYTFDGWTRTGTGSSLSGRTFTMGTSNATLTAKWSVNSYTLTVKPNSGIWNGSTADQTFTMKYGESRTIANPTRTGYTFSGWTLSGAGSNLAGTTFTMGSANATLTAKWTINSYKLTVKPNGGTWEGKTDLQNFTLDYKATKTITDPARPGYTFIDWSVSGTGSSLNGKTFTMGSADAVLMANWTANTYTIAFDGNGATEGSMTSIAATVDALPIQLPANAFKRTTEQGDSLFLGWALAKEPEGRAVKFQNQAAVNENLALDQGATVTLYAIWDDCPQITAEDRYFNLFWAQNGKITEEELLRTAKAVDKEDIELTNRTKAQIETEGLPGSLSLFDYHPENFTSMTEDSTVSLTYQAVDSVGNTVYETVQVHVYSSAAIPLPEKYTRYINRKYYEKSYEEGGLHPNSKWRTDPEYKKALEEALENEENDTPIASYYFTNEEVKEAQDYVTEHGIGDTKEPGALQRFFDLFMR